MTTTALPSSMPPASAVRASSVTRTSRFRWLARAGAAVWRALEEAGQARAQAHLLAFADRCESQQPELAKELRLAARQGPLA
jgi:phosphatidylserine/phosphatidylglycerophosphate/cardiolipin synthase-like enzyme